MDNLYFKQYTQDVLKLSRSMIIKFDGIARQINEELKVQGYQVDPDDRTSWKYYLNINGKRHESDKPMYIKSSDTLEIIEFTKENLMLHLSTLREVYPGSYLYNSLVREYPDQEQLIRGIIFPVDINTAIAAEDGTILYYDKTLVEGNEDDLMANIQEWVKLFIFRWYNRAYDLVDDFNLTTFIGNLFKTLPVTIMTHRLRNCNSNKAHSYYVKEYLASHNGLDEFFDYLDLRQRLWLYRNIRFLRYNAAKQDTFDRLVDNILTPRGIPIIKYYLMQDSRELVDKTYNDVKLLKEDINLITINENDIEDYYEDVDHVLDRENDLARDNVKVRNETLEKAVNDVSSSAHSSLLTKVLDSEVIDRSNSNVRNLTNFLLTQWAWLASQDKYRAYTSITNPRSGEFMILSVKDVFILMIYCYLKYHDREPEYIPTFYGYEALRDPLPNFFELRQIAPSSIIPDRVLIEYQKLFRPMSTYISTEQFYRDASEAHKLYLKQWEAYSYQEHRDGRAYAEQIFKRHYVNFKCELVDRPTTYTEFFKESGIDVSNLRGYELAQVATDCYIRATGSDLFTEITVSEIQRSLLELMARLSSYSIQFIRNTELSNFHVISSNIPRIGKIDYEGYSVYRGNYSEIYVKALETHGERDIELKESVITPDLEYDYDIEQDYQLDPTINIRDITHLVQGYNLPLHNLGVRSIEFVTTEPDPNINLEYYED